MDSLLTFVCPGLGKVTLSHAKMHVLRIMKNKTKNKNKFLKIVLLFIFGEYFQRMYLFEK